MSILKAFLPRLDIINYIGLWQAEGILRFWKLLWHCIHGPLGVGESAMSHQDFLQPFTFHYQQFYWHLQEITGNDVALQVVLHIYRPFLFALCAQNLMTC